MISRLKYGFAALAVVSLIVVSNVPAVAGYWLGVATGGSGKKTCVHYSSDTSDTLNDVTDANWSGNPPSPAVYPGGNVTGGHVAVSGTMYVQFAWQSSNSKNDPPPFKTWVKIIAGASAVVDGHPATPSQGSVTNSIGSPTPEDPYHATAYTYVDSESGSFSISVDLSADVDSSAETAIGASIGLSTEVNISSPPSGARTVKLPPSACSAMPMHPGRLLSSTNYANYPPGDPVNLATGEHTYSPGSDTSVYNAYGPPVIYQRNYLSSLAKDGKHSPGLPVGWNDGFDIKLTAPTPSAWGDLQIIYPNEATETVSPVVSGGTPTGHFTVPVGSEYFVTGVPSTTNVGQWNQISITHKDHMKWQFSRVGTDTYLLSAIANRMGGAINIVRRSSSDLRISVVQDDQSSPTPLLSFDYYEDADGNLKSITDCYGRKVTYSYGTHEYYDQNNQSTIQVKYLLTVSQVTTEGSPAARSTYGYIWDDSGVTPIPYLSTVSVPNPTGSGQSTQSFEHDSLYRVSSIQDGNYNTNEYHYDYPDATWVVVRDNGDNGLRIQQDFLVSFDPNHSCVLTAIKDRHAKTSTRQYADSNNPFLPTTITDKLGKAVVITYDQCGNIVTATSARGTVTTYTYDYSVFPLGRLVSIQEGSNLDPQDRKPPTTVAYFDNPPYPEPPVYPQIAQDSGLIRCITSPKPGGVGPNGGTVSTSYTYDFEDNQNAGTRRLGNILSITGPGNNATTAITTTYSYGPYADVKLGQPKTITDQLGHATHLEYDDRGNVTATTDALGNKVNFTYNLADQVTNIISPHTAASE